MLRTFSLYILIFCIGAAVPTISNYIRYEAMAKKAPKNSEIKSIELNHSNHILINDTITDRNVAKWQQKFLELAKLRSDKKYTIYIVLDSNGGSVFAGSRFVDLVRQYQNVKTISINAASMAHAIVQSLPGERLATRNNMMLAHPMTVSFQGTFNSAELQNMTDDFKALEEIFSAANAERIGVSLSYYMERTRYNWITRGFHSVVYNFADRIVDIKCSNELILDTHVETVDTFFDKIQIVVSACPVIVPYTYIQPKLQETQNEPTI